MDTNRGQHHDRADDAVARRLARLRAIPVETARLERALRVQLPQRERTLKIWLRPLRAVAASVAVLVLVGALLLATSGGPVLASTSQMVQMHEDLVSGRTPVVQVDSIEAANKALSAQWPHSPGVP